MIAARPDSPDWNRGGTVRLDRIAGSADDVDRRLLELDAVGITDKQREAVRAAVEADDGHCKPSY